MTVVKVARNHGHESGLTWYFSWGIYTSIPNWTNWKNALATAQALSFKRYLPLEHISNSQKTVPISKRIVITYAMKQGILFLVWWKSMETKTTTWSEFPNGRKDIVEKILASEECNKSKEQDCEGHSQGSM